MPRIDDEEDNEESTPRARKPRAAKPVRRSSSGFQVPSLDLSPHPRQRTFGLKFRRDPGNADAARSRAGRFRRARRNHRCAAGPGGHALRAEPAPASILARHQSRRRYCALDERAVGACRRRFRAQCHRHRIAQSGARESLSARASCLARLCGDGLRLPSCLGKAIGGEAVMVDLARMPHLLIAGTTGSGKSVAINTMIFEVVSYRLHPDQCRLIMVDPKMLELSVYDGIPHLLTPVVTDPKKAVVALKWAVREMEERYKKMSKLGVRNIDGYNARVAEANKKGEKLNRTIHTGYRSRYRPGDLRERRTRSRAAALYRRHRRRNGRPDDGRRQGHRRRGAAAGANGACRRPACGPGDAAADRSMSSPARSRRTSRPAFPSRSPRRSTAAPFWANRAPNSCSAKVICSTWRAAAASAACTDHLFPTRKSKRSCVILKSAGSAGISRSRHRRRADRRGRQSGVRCNRDGRRRRRRPLIAGGGDHHPRPQGVDQAIFSAGCRSAIIARLR